MGYWKRVLEQRAFRMRLRASEHHNRRMAFLSRWEQPVIVAACYKGVVFMGRSLRELMGTRTSVDPLVEAVDREAEARWPCLLLLMTSREVLNKKPRQTATLTLLSEEGVFKGGLNDRETARSLWVSSDTLMGVLDTLEAALNVERPQWRSRPQPGQSRGRAVI